MQRPKAAGGEGREVYACRVRGLDAKATRFHELASLTEWQSLPDGSVVLVDECYEDIPSRGSGKTLPEWEQALATHRHRGFDFILICQMGSQISTFVRALIDTHVHVRRKFGLNRSVLLQWDRYCASVASDSEIKSARHTSWKYPKEIFQLYKSAEVHTVKRNIPWQVFAIPILLGVVVLLVWSFFHRFYQRDPLKNPTANANASANVAGAKAPEKKKLTAAEYLQSTVPLVPGMPWSSPIFADRKTRAEPEIYCISMQVEDGAKQCKCLSEQGTLIKVYDDVCIQIAEHGLYNPYREPIKDRASGGIASDPLDRQYYRIQLDSDRSHASSDRSSRWPEAPTLPSASSARGASSSQRPPGTGVLGYGPASGTL